MNSFNKKVFNKDYSNLYDLFYKKKLLQRSFID